MKPDHDHTSRTIRFVKLKYSRHVRMSAICLLYNYYNYVRMSVTTLLTKYSFGIKKKLDKIWQFEIVNNLLKLKSYVVMSKINE